ncbi:MAG: glycosyltransferase [Candidatus Cloacimonadota bacterium]|nr:glycosyltransferase [Candidatus Cloacimonadota bacterium]
MKKDIKEVIFINNTVAPYRIPLFNEIKKMLNKENINMKVLFLSEKESVREWSIDYSKIQFDYEVLPVLYQKRDTKTTTSDKIVNSGFFKYLLADRVVLFGYNYYTYLIFMIIRKMLFKKTILFSESTLSDKVRKNGIGYKLKSFLIKNFFSSFLVPGLEAKKFIESYGIKSEKISIAPNAVEPLKDIGGIKKDENYITLLYVGRLAKEKNIDFIINNIPNSDTFKYKLIIVGTGEEEQHLKSIRVDYPIEFRGFEEGDKLAATFKESDIFVLASNSEPWGLVVNEAISLGVVPIVSDRVGCRHELVQDNGEMFKLNDIKIFQDKIIKVSNDLDEYKEKSLSLSKNITIENQAKKMCEGVVNGSN